MSRDKKIQELEHEIYLLKQKLQIAELQAEIEKKKREKAEAQSGRSPWTVTWNNSAPMYTDAQGARMIAERIKKHMKDGPTSGK